MAIDKLVDSSQLDNNLTLVANAIRTKGGTSASLSFPTEYITAINAISGGDSGYTRTVVASEQSVTSAYRRTENIDGYFAEITITEPLEEWSDYIVTLDGDEYYTTGILMWGVDISLGIESYFWDETSGTSRSIPFGILYDSGSTCTMAVNSARTMSVKIEKIELTGSGGSGGSATLITKTITANGTYSASDDNADGYSEVTVNLPVTWETKSEQDITISSDGTYNYAVWTYTEPLQANETYRITWGENGTQYVCQTVADSTGNTYDGYFLGNASVVNLGEDTGEPFIIYRINSTRMVVTTTRETGSWHIKVEKQVQISATLTTKTITENGTYTALNDSADGYSEVVVNVSSGGSEPTYETVFDDSINIGDYISIESLADLYFAEGETWRVTWDGTEYICSTQLYDGYLWTVGNQSLASTDDGLNEPFCLYNYGSGAMNGNARTGGTHTLKLEKQTSSGGSTNPLSGKILAVTGDSIAAGAGYTGGYAGIIGSEQGMIVQNIAVGGGTIVNTGSTFCISESISSLRSDADFILLEGGGNDSDANITLGTLTSGYTDTLDTTTFAGAFEQMLKSTIARFPNKKIGYILIHKCAYQFDSRVPNSYYDMVINACKKWGIPYLDLNTQVPPLNYIADLRTTYTANSDGYHPNELGYRTFYVPKITAFLNTMLTDNSLINKIVTTNGTYLAETDNADGYSSVTVSVTPNLQSKSATPTTSSQTVSPDNGYDGLSSVTVGAIPSQYVVPTGNKAITENGNNIDVAEYATVSVSVSGSSKNVQTVQSTTRSTSSTYTEVITLTCSTTGTYDVYWSTFRSSTSGTWGSQLYINDTAYGSAQTGSWSNHIQNIHLTGVSISANQEVAIRVRSRGSNYYGYVGTLTIVQTA